MGTTSVAGTAYHSVAPEFTPVFSGVRITLSSFMCMFSRSFAFGYCVVCPSIYGFWLSLCWL